MPAPWPRRMAVALACGFGLALSGCSSGMDLGDNRAGLSCIDDSTQCVEQRQATLKAMLADKDHGWIKEPPSAHAHASGVRLFAFRSTKTELSCEQLAYGRKEAEGAPKALKSSQGLSPAQISRASLFAAEVNKELTVEMKKRRCRV